LRASLYILFFAVLLASCGTGEEEFGPDYPAYFPDPVYSFANNPLSKEVFELGRALFHDPILSVDSTISCASCHAQVHAFADHSTRLSAGVDGRLGLRNSPPIVNVLWQPTFMWDGGVNHIEVFSVAPITNPLEMDLSMRDALDRLRASDKYASWFEEVFVETPINDQQMLYALTQYMTMLISTDSKYDQYRQGDYEFTPEEEAGYQLFKQNCNSCHTEPLFTDHSMRSNGKLPDNPHETGRHMITLDSADMYKFKVPTLRNVELTYPYMHDGSLRRLGDVLDHYSDGVEPLASLDPSLKRGDQPGIALSQQDKLDLEAFLLTLTDYTFISDVELSE
jgi:cytochrome c peroxidase